MSPETRAAPVRSERDKLEKLQEQLREVRLRSTSLRREKAELLVRTSALEEEMRGMRRALGMTQDELERPAPSLPEQFLVPFQVSPALGSTYVRVRSALKRLPASVWRCAHMVFGLLWYPQYFFEGLGAMMVALLVLHVLFPTPEDSAEYIHWSFDEEGFFPTDADANPGKVLYRDIRKVWVDHGFFQHFIGLGAVHVTCPDRVVKMHPSPSAW